MIRWIARTGASALLLVVLAGCEAKAPADSACLWLQPVSYCSRVGGQCMAVDTPETIEQNRVQNAKIFAVCPNLRPVR